MTALLWLTAVCGASTELNALDRQIVTQPADPRPRLQAAELRVKAGEQLDRALLDVDVARSLSPEDPRAHYLFGLLMEERGEAATAKDAYQTALALNDTHDDARFRLAGLYFRERAFGPAAEAYGRYVKAHPDASGARLQLAAALEQMGDKSRAEAELKAMYADPKTREMAGRRLAELYDRSGREHDAAKIRAAVEPPRRRLRDLKRSAR
jgi:tetratricopeptide (TPR) repeat protein